MRLSWRWLGGMTDLAGVTPEAGREALTFATAEIEALHPYGGGLAGVVTGRVVSVRPHPQADRLRLCAVDAGDGPPREVVCGAPNVAAGQVVVYAREGVTLPGGLTLTRRRIRGVESAGMICAEDELGLGPDHDGILVLPPGTPVGIPAGDALGLPDTVLELSNTAITHRPDLWGHVGFARELAAALGRPFRPPQAPAATAAAAAAGGEPFPVEVRDAAGCRRYVALVLDGVGNGPSPEPVRRRLAALGQRSIDLLVDLTNLVMLEQGQPLHAFDLARLPEGRIVVRGAAPGERLRTLDGVDRVLHAGDLLICAGERPVAVAGVMGCEDSGVGPATRSVLLESACFDPARIRRTAGRLGLRTEASTRFEKALDPEGALAAALRFAELVLEHSPGARLERRVADAYPHPPAPLGIDLPYEMVRKRLGVRIPDAEVKGALTALGFEVRGEDAHRLRVAVPSWRATKDVSRAEDLVEEVGRMRRYAGIAPVAPLAPMSPTLPSPARRLERRLGDALALELGYVETLSPAFYGPVEARALGLEAVAHVGILHPLSEEQDRLMLTTAAPLLRVAQRNQAREARGRVFEQDRLVLPAAPRAGLPTEVPVVGLLAWDREAAEAPPGALFRAVLEDLRRLLGRATTSRVEVADHRGETLAAGLPLPGWLHPGRRAAFRVRGQVVAVAGEVAPAAARGLGLEGRAVHGEVSLPALLAACAADASPYRPVHRYPVVTFDVAVVVPRRTPAAEVAAAIEAAAPGHVQDVVAFDEYEGPGIPEGTRSLAFTCSLLDPEATVTPERADALRGLVRRAVETRGWSVRAAAG